jgi:hypothetical protein
MSGLLLGSMQTIALLLAASAVLALPPVSPQQPQLWVLSRFNIQAGTSQTTGLIDQMVAAGYTGM